MDRTFDLIYNLYEDLQSYLLEKGLLILDRNTFNDFNEFCLRHIPRLPDDTNTCDTDPDTDKNPDGNDPSEEHVRLNPTT